MDTPVSGSEINFTSWQPLNCVVNCGWNCGDRWSLVSTFNYSKATEWRSGALLL